ncbi:hypothetical protein GA0116948_1112 [Chitinophaga costaii]|uniref:DUF4476 domain-containing protein n=1 Tax=Chitinophaga costaii TaxID=1335309 RepID=A0A1C4F0L9_9BACT|nr:DUF4476 domain-containing protein [Chitinophaga costaii]PUZ22172.1 hypothetical protein DCM91_15765 [Chitinophaga costaii]SCC49497.1 hypothetical protein GA0116948_1112 [Chitinophaga costaii]
MLTYIKKSLFILLLLASTSLWANDEHHFIYIQSEKGELFYVRYKGKVLSASAKGYVIVPELPKGIAEVIVGFPKNEIPEKHFSISLSGTRDEGFVIKHTGAQDIALFNLQTYTLLKPTSPGTSVAAATTPEPASTDNVTSTDIATPAAANTSTAMMGQVKKDLDSTFANKQDITVSDGSNVAQVVSPSSAPAAAKQSSKFASALDKVVSDDRPVEVEASPVAVDSSATPVATTPEKAVKKAVKSAVDQDPLTDEEKTYLADVMAEERKAAAEEAAVKAPAAANIDTVASVTPAVTEALPVATPVADTTTATAYTETSSPSEPASGKKKKKHSSADDPQFIDFSTGANNTPADAATTSTDVKVPSPRKKKKQHTEGASQADSSGSLTADEWVTVNKPTNANPADASPAPAKSAASEGPALNSDCKQMLNNEGFKRLMKRVSAQNNESGMVEIFNKNIRNTCLSADQIRAFAQLIDTDEYRYKLLETAYLHTYETKAFIGLQDLLKDDYYRKRFNAMLR